ncbi:MAG TPA: dynamin family protein [Streptosporangiaceae bacterium]|nr:dynamin family protein [Streptosporangiaceae bacterium]
MTAGILDRVHALCGQAADRLPAQAAASVRQAAAGLAGPLRLAFVGRVSSGKSTLVNAYLGRRLAPTDEGECTKVVTVIRFGPADRARVLMRDGSALPLALEPAGTLPSRLGAELDEVQLIEVELSLEVLRDTIIIDTPGLNSFHAENSERTHQALGIDAASQSAAATADAIVFVLNAQARDDEREILSQFRGVSLGLNAAPSNAVGLLAKADEVNADNPWTAATELAAWQARHLRHDIATVLPVIGLLAETVETQFGEDDADAVRLLASLGPDAREEMLYSGDYFLDYESAVDPARRFRLYDMLRGYGLRCLLTAADAGASTPAMAALLTERSGMAALRAEVGRRFTSRTAALKAARALAVLRAAADRPDVDQDTHSQILGGIDDLMLDPAMHALEELRALSLVSSGEAQFPDEDRAAALQILTTTDPAARLGLPAAGPDATLAAAGATAQRWLAIANTALSPRSRDAARVIVRSLDIDRDQLGGQQP